MALNDSSDDSSSVGSREEVGENLSPKDANRLNPYFVEDFSSWLSAINYNLVETGATRLDLKSKGLKAKDIKVILESLENTQVVDLDLEGNYLKNGIKIISEALVRSKIKELNIDDCGIIGVDFLDFMEILNATMITSLKMSSNYVEYMPEDESQKIISHLLKSQLRTLGFGSTCFFETYGRAAESFAEGLPNTSITCLDIKCSTLHRSSLLSHLPQTSITELNLHLDCITIGELKVLGKILENSKLEKLVLSDNDISDAGINFLVPGLRDSKVVDLNLNANDLSGSNNLGHYLKGSRVRTLNIGYNPIKRRRMFSFPDFLQGTSVVSLNIGNCNLGDKLGQELMASLKSTLVTELNFSKNKLGPSTISEFAKNVSDLNVINIDFSGNEFSAEMFVILGSCLKNSKLKCINVGSCCKCNEAVGLFYFLERTKNTSVVSVNIADNKLGTSNGKLLGLVLTDTPLTHLNASRNNLESSVSILAAHLRSTNITHLDLTNNDLEDDTAEALAKSLKDSRVVELDLSNNSISSQGAKALAFALKESNLLSLKLGGNKIDRDGLEALAKHAESSFITTLHVHHNLGDRILLVDAALWKNRTAVHKLVNLFKNIAPEAVNKDSCFNLRKHDKNVENLLEDCLVFYKTALKNLSSAAAVLAQEESLLFTKEQIATILTDFPEQLASFVGREVEADVEHHVHILEKAEELGLTNIVELLLLNRPVYLVDQTQNILHPRVYKLLHKYRQPLCNVGVEPEVRKKIINYFREHSDLEGALDVIAVLQDAKLL